MQLSPQSPRTGWLASATTIPPAAILWRHSILISSSCELEFFANLRKGNGRGVHLTNQLAPRCRLDLLTRIYDFGSHRRSPRRHWKPRP